MNPFPRYFLIIVLVSIAIGLSFLANSYLNEASPDEEKSTTEYVENPNDQEASVEEYVRKTINDLSPEDPVLGGTFFVTEIETEDGAGTVWYEDGHIAFVADFTFVREEDGVPRITSFVLRE